MPGKRMLQGWLFMVLAIAGLFWTASSEAQEPERSKAEQLFRVGTSLVDKTHYLEALDLLEEARMLLEKIGAHKSELYADLLFSLAQAKIKGRIHQGFPADYVKVAREEIQKANRLRDKLPTILPQKLAEGLYLEGFILSRFFMRKEEALLLFSRCVEVDHGHSACKRELSAVLPSGEHEQPVPKTKTPRPRD